MDLPAPFTLADGAIRFSRDGAHAAFTLRSLGDVRADPAPLRELAGRPVRTARQVHGTHVAEAAAREADGLLVRGPDEAVAVFVADCLPVVLVGEGAVAAVHAGWRGIAAGVLTEAVRVLGPTRTALLGPGARGCCYEVGEEVHERFAGYDGRRGARNLDLAAVAAAQLAAAGVPEILDTGMCSMCHRDAFFSHRHEAEAAGRQAGVAWVG